ncbi:retinoblastoma-like protein 2 isoform X3 [Scophthalmus maximus]|uniref:retinoblastoma-like protein 2 isoform X3 n=1 Tax=Scophthalmus maximus TaxID=52904 RepID=UPI001FA860FF|nr:retinoblastoma-like protein 2 isoform X3 [Scophthalmus maximus]XP_035484724.2 retinoblastoma-like protein 2 isoform X3 [Scophthalmus maximus]
MATDPRGNRQEQRTCCRDPTGAMKERLTRMLHTFQLHHRGNLGNERTKELAAKCCGEAESWYYRILESLLSQERRRLGLTDITGILEADLLHCCLVACCLEITICSNYLPCDLPQLLQILRVASYHFWRVIELVLRAEVGLPHAVVRHLSRAEEKVLESLSWTSGSPLWEEIRADGGRLPTCQQVTPPAQLDGPNTTDLQSDPEPPAVHVSLCLPALTSTCFPSAVNRPQRGSSLHLFARKVYSLMGRRLRALCSALDVSDKLRLKIWTCFEYSLVHCTHLMADRHLDQLLMCAIYVIAKITEEEIPFKRIMKCYKSQPHASESICKNVRISGRDADNSPNNNGDPCSSIPTPNEPTTHYPGPYQEQRGSLIYFYNQVYTTEMQHFAKQFALTSGGDTPPLSPYPRQWKASPRRRQLSSSPSVYISPYKPETPSPRASGLCYYFSSSPPECLRDINDMIRAGGSANKRGYAVSLDEEEEDGGEQGPSAKRRRSDEQSAWQRRLRDVVDNRVARGSQDQPSPAEQRIAEGSFADKTMGCNTSRGITVVDPSEKPEERPQTATSTEEASAGETNGTADKDKDEKTQSSG